MRAGLERMNFMKHDQDVGAVSRIMARRRKTLKAAKYLCDEYLVLNRAETKPGMTAGDSTACLASPRIASVAGWDASATTSGGTCHAGICPNRTTSAGSAQACGRHLSWADQVRSA